MKMVLYLCGLPPQNLYKSGLIIIKRSDKFQQRSTLSYTWLTLLKTVKVNKNKEDLSNCHSQEQPKETTKCNVDGILEQKKNIR